MKCQLSNTTYGLEFSMEKNDFERLKSFSGKKRNDFVANPIYQNQSLIAHTLHQALYSLISRIYK